MTFRCSENDIFVDEKLLKPYGPLWVGNQVVALGIWRNLILHQLMGPLNMCVAWLILITQMNMIRHTENIFAQCLIPCDAWFHVKETTNYTGKTQKTASSQFGHQWPFIGPVEPQCLYPGGIRHPGNAVSNSGCWTPVAWWFYICYDHGPLVTYGKSPPASMGHSYLWADPQCRTWMTSPYRISTFVSWTT